MIILINNQGVCKRSQIKVSNVPKEKLPYVRATKDAYYLTMIERGAFTVQSFFKYCYE